MMSGGTGLGPNQTGSERAEELEYPSAPDLPADDNRSSGIDPVNLEDRFGDASTAGIGRRPHVRQPRQCLEPEPKGGPPEARTFERGSAFARAFHIFGIAAMSRTVP